jgi:hypothetical protein
LDRWLLLRACRLRLLDRWLIGDLLFLGNYSVPCPLSHLSIQVVLDAGWPYADWPLAFAFARGCLLIKNLFAGYGVDLLCHINIRQSEFDAGWGLHYEWA